jgi:DNA-binding MarR family transcriptional regulator
MMAPSIARRLERIIKGFANHRRVRILTLLQGRPGLSLSEIRDEFDVDIRTASEHVRKCVAGGLVAKRSVGRRVVHRLTPRGKRITSFLHRLAAEGG